VASPMERRGGIGIPRIEATNWPENVLRHSTQLPLSNSYSIR
jgi:hypothetical protein